MYFELFNCITFLTIINSIDRASRWSLIKGAFEIRSHDDADLKAVAMTTGEDEIYMMSFDPSIMLPHACNCILYSSFCIRIVATSDRTDPILKVTTGLPLAHLLRQCLDWNSSAMTLQFSGDSSTEIHLYPSSSPSPSPSCLQHFTSHHSDQLTS